MPTAAGLYYFVSGAENLLRPPIILIHGAGGHHLFWPPQVRRLHGQRIFALDLPGHGKSPGLGCQTISEYTDALLRFVQGMRLSTFVLAGHSMGGAIALDAAIRQAGRVLGLFLVGSGAKLRVAPELLRATSESSDAVAAATLLTDLSFSRSAEARLKDLSLKRLSETRLPVLHGDLLACDSFDARSGLSQIASPSCVVCGEEDRMTPPAYSSFLAQHLALASLELVPHAGHMVMLEKPIQIAGLLTAFTDSLGYRPGS